MLITIILMIMMIKNVILIFKVTTIIKVEETIIAVTIKTTTLTMIRDYDINNVDDHK